MFEVIVTTGSNGETMTFKGDTLQDIITQVTSVGASLEEDDYEDDLEDTDGCECCGNFVDLMDTLYSKLHTAAEIDNLQAVDVYSKAIQRLLAVA
jgi:hypothetical protein